MVLTWISWRQLILLALLTLPVRATDPLPRVLILGDSVYSTPAINSANMLRGRVELVRVSLKPGEVLSTRTALTQLETWLGDENWDLIHFNFGLGDLVYRAPGMKSFRILSREAGGIRTTSAQQYEKNLVELVGRLKTKGAKLIWASTTPIRHSASHVFQLGSEIEYNSIAAKVMAAQDVPTNDMYIYVRNLIDMNRPASHGADPFHFDRKPLYPPIVRSILKELDLTRPVEGPVKVFVMVGGWSHIGGGIVMDSTKPRPGQNRGTLDELVLGERTRDSYRHLLAEDGTWATRPDVWVQFDRRGPKSGALGIGYGGDRKRGIGSELALGHVLGDHFDQQVCILKTALGDPSLATDLRPPSSGKTGKSYTLLLQQIHDSLARLQDKFPDYTDESGYELSGLVLNLGENDPQPELYAEYLPMLINDLRKDLRVEKLPVVLVGTGRGGRDEPDFPAIIEAQQSVAARTQIERGGNVTFVETRDFWPGEDARDAWRHPSHASWYNNAESFCRMGDAVGRALLRTLR